MVTALVLCASIFSPVVLLFTATFQTRPARNPTQCRLCFAVLSLLFAFSGLEALRSDRKGFSTKKDTDVRARRNIAVTTVVLLHVLVLFPLHRSLLMNRLSSRKLFMTITWMYVILREASTLMHPSEFMILERRSAQTRFWMLRASD